MRFGTGGREGLAVDASTTDSFIFIASFKPNPPYFHNQAGQTPYRKSPLYEGAWRRFAAAVEGELWRISNLITFNIVAIHFLQQPFASHTHTG